MRLRLFPSRRSALAAALLLPGLLMIAPPALAAPGGTLRDFRLPPDPEAPASQPAPQGPVAPDVPASTQVLRQTPTPTPTLTPSPIPAPTASAVVQPLPAASAPPPVVVPPSVTPASGARPGAAGAPPPQSAAPSLEPQAEEGAEPPLPASLPTASPLPLPSSRPAVTVEAEEGGPSWLWIIAALLAIAALAFAAWFLRRRTGQHSATAVPLVERPSLTPEPLAPAAEPATPAPAPEPPAAAVPAEATTRPGLELELEPLRLSLTLMNATLSYRLLLNNHGAEPLETLTIAADMIAAHATLSREQQLSGPDAGALQVACIERLEPGESRIVSGEFRLPFGQITPVRQGNAALLFPLARFRIEGADREPVTRTFLVAQPPERDGAGLQPFRLDLGPRIYPRLARRAFA